jgi:hypothetical protein
MALSNAVVGARHTAQRITWQDADGDPLNLTGATLTGRRLNLESGIAAAVDGTLSVIDGPAGVFSWDYGENDVATAAVYQVQFTATFGGGEADKTLAELWEVFEAL